jgi:hypothetical protein
MSAIWEYSDSEPDKNLIQNAVQSNLCQFCNERLEKLRAESEKSEYEAKQDSVIILTNFNVDVCPVCGWWTVQKEWTTAGASVASTRTEGAAGMLRELDLSDIDVPLQEVRSYLAARYERRFDLHPRLFEETVASVFRDLGYGARVTAYSGDDGIDVILDGPRGDTIGVQVKRYKNTIQVEQIRALTGALVLGGMTKGIFVTTSAFQSGANATVRRLDTKGYRIKLVDASHFYDALKIAQRAKYKYRDDLAAPYNNVPLRELWSSTGVY